MMKSGDLKMTETEIRSDLKELRDLIHEIKLDVELIKDHERTKNEEQKQLKIHQRTLYVAIIIWVVQTSATFFVQILPKLQVLWSVTP